jgi:hypothetical protein
LDFVKINEKNVFSWLTKTYFGKKIANPEDVAKNISLEENIEAGDLVVLGIRDEFISVRS